MRGLYGDEGVGFVSPRRGDLNRSALDLLDKEERTISCHPYGVADLLGAFSQGVALGYFHALPPGERRV
jgi:hypothetical protein